MSVQSPNMRSFVKTQLMLSIESVNEKRRKNNNRTYDGGGRSEGSSMDEGRVGERARREQRRSRRRVWSGHNQRRHAQSLYTMGTVCFCGTLRECIYMAPFCVCVCVHLLLLPIEDFSSVGDESSSKVVLVVLQTPSFTCIILYIIITFCLFHFSSFINQYISIFFF